LGEKNAGDTLYYQLSVLGLSFLLAVRGPAVIGPIFFTHERPPTPKASHEMEWERASVVSPLLFVQNIFLSPQDLLTESLNTKPLHFLFFGAGA